MKEILHQVKQVFIAMFGFVVDIAIIDNPILGLGTAVCFMAIVITMLHRFHRKK